MIYRVVIIDNENQVSLTQQGNATPYFDGEGMEIDDEMRAIMIEALDKLKEAKLDER